MSVSVQDIVAAQAHIGTLKNEAHPKTSKYWSEVTNGLVVINPEVIAEQLENAKKKVAEAKAALEEVLAQACASMPKLGRGRVPMDVATP